MSISPDLSRISPLGYSFSKAGMLSESAAKKNQIPLSETPARVPSTVSEITQGSHRPANIELETPCSPTAGKTDPAASFSFRDVLDVINPLHHIPIIGGIYRAVTGDEIKAPARILGGGIFGGIIGAVVGIINTVLSEVTGKDAGEHMMAAFNNDSNEKQEFITDKNQTFAGMATASDVTGNSIEVPGNPEKLLPVRSILPHEETRASNPASESWTVIDSPNPIYPIDTLTPSSIFEKNQDVFLDFCPSRTPLSALEFYQNISNIDMLTDDEQEREKGKSLHLYG